MSDTVTTPAGNIGVWVSRVGDNRIGIQLDHYWIKIDARGARTVAAALLSAADDADQGNRGAKQVDVPIALGAVTVMELGQIEGEQGAYDGVGLRMSSAQVRELAEVVGHTAARVTMHLVWPSEAK